jgi:hypothetical protein
MVWHGICGFCFTCEPYLVPTLQDVSLLFRILFQDPVLRHPIITIYEPMIYTAPCVMFLMRADTLRGEVVGGLALEISSRVPH